MVALDTNTLIHFYKGTGRVAERMLARPLTDISVPSVVVYELEIGFLRSADPDARRAQLRSFLANVTLLHLGEAEAKAAARIAVALASRGTPIGPLDTLIAGTALANGATLVTRNVREYARIDGLTVENWFD